MSPCLRSVVLNARTVEPSFRVGVMELPKMRSTGTNSMDTSTATAATAMMANAALRHALVKWLFCEERASSSFRSSNAGTCTGGVWGSSGAGALAYAGAGWAA